MTARSGGGGGYINQNDMLTSAVPISHDEQKPLPLRSHSWMSSRRLQGQEQEVLSQQTYSGEGHWDILAGRSLPPPPHSA